MEILGLLFIICMFWLVQLKTRYFSTKYYLQIASLLVISTISLYLVIKYLAILTDSPAFYILLTIALGLLFLFHFGLVFVKGTSASDSKYRWMHYANRALVNYDCPHQRFILRTTDGVKLQALSLHRANSRRDKAIIVCHGAGRSKNTIPIVQTCMLLSTEYDVFTFDFRGHMESSGVFQANGDTEYDLQAMIDYVEKQGYSRIGVVGWSIGAWTALLSASKGRHIDTIIAGSPPPVEISDLFQTRAFQKLTLLQIPLMASIAVIRNMWTNPKHSNLKLHEFINGLPPIPILLVYNEYDYTLGVTAEVFEDLYDKLPQSKQKLVLPGRGHLFDWPNTYFLWKSMFDWLKINL